MLIEDVLIIYANSMVDEFSEPDLNPNHELIESKSFILFISLLKSSMFVISCSPKISALISLL